MLHSPEYHRGLPDSFGAAEPTTMKSDANSQHTCSCSTNQGNTKIPSQKSCLSYPSTHPSAAQLPSDAVAPFAQAGKQCPFFWLDKILSIPCCAEAASQNCTTSPAHLHDAAVNPKRRYLTCHSVTSLTASNGKGTGEKCCKLINIRPLVAVCYCKQTF